MPFLNMKDIATEMIATTASIHCAHPWDEKFRKKVENIRNNS